MTAEDFKIFIDKVKENKVHLWYSSKELWAYLTSHEGERICISPSTKKVNAYKILNEIISENKLKHSS